ncbi:MAG: cyclic nucleotide-binding domain-containing protein [bacterium]|nr:cyclic nucleotide-binding domain-containing protein [bacterium]
MDKTEVLKNTEIFSGLTKEELTLLEGIAGSKEYDENTEIFHEGDKSQEMYILLEGRVIIEIQLKLQSEKAAVHTVSEGQVFGEVALVDGEPRSATATTAKSSKLLVIKKEDLDRIIESSPRIGYQILKNFSKILCSRVRKTTRELRSSLMFN